jgi:leucine-rich repeat protein SHOC2
MFQLFETIGKFAHELVSASPHSNVMRKHSNNLRLGLFCPEYYALNVLLANVDSSFVANTDRYLDSFGCHWSVLLENLGYNSGFIPEYRDKAIIKSSTQLFELITCLASKTSLKLNRAIIKSLSEAPSIVNDVFDLTSDLQSLSSICINYISLQSLPDSIGNFSNLTLLDLKSNNLTELPASIGNLIDLESIDLSQNQLTHLPQSIGNLSKLTSLNIKDNQLSTLPDSIGNLTELTWIDIEGNRLTSLPDSIGNLSQLEHFFLSNNQLDKLPDRISQLDSLRILDLSENLLTDLPESITNLSKLEDLNLGSNKLTKLPKNIDRLSSLEAINLNDNLLSSLPDSICNLSELYGLGLSGNKLTRLPDAIGRLTNLYYLHADDNQIDILPTSIKNLTELTALYLDNNRLTSLPKSILQLGSLTELSIHGNPIEDLSILQKMPDLEKLQFLGVELPRRYWTKLSVWKSEWLLDEDNVEIRQVLIEQIGYEKICADLQAIALDTWREYTLLKIDGVEAIHEDVHAGMPIESKIMVVDREPMLLLKMTCPSTGHIHILRVPPEMTSAEAAIIWVNHGIHPDKFSVQT